MFKFAENSLEAQSEELISDHRLNGRNFKAVSIIQHKKANSYKWRYAIGNTKPCQTEAQISEGATEKIEDNFAAFLLETSTGKMWSSRQDTCHL